MLFRSGDNFLHHGRSGGGRFRRLKDRGAACGDGADEGAEGELDGEVIGSGGNPIVLALFLRTSV